MFHRLSQGLTFALAAWSASSFVVPSAFITNRATWTGRPATCISLNRAPCAVSVDCGRVLWYLCVHRGGCFAGSIGSTSIVLHSGDAVSLAILDAPCAKKCQRVCDNFVSSSQMVAAICRGCRIPREHQWQFVSLGNVRKISDCLGQSYILPSAASCFR